jgi:cellulose biosynthesis protein BcsQ
MKNITVGSFKGGVGKSTVSLNFAYKLSQYYKVLLVDSDPQNSLAFFMCQNFKKGLSEVLFEDEIIDNVIKQPFSKENSNFYFLPAGNFCISNPTVYEEEFSIDRIKTFINKIKKFEFDYILYDTPPRISKHIETLIEVSDDFLLVLTPDPATYSSFTIFLRFLEEYDLKDKVFSLINKVTPTSISDDFTKLINMYFRDKNLGILPNDFSVVESQGKCKPDILYNPDSPFSIFIKKAVSKYLELTDNNS